MKSFISRYFYIIFIILSFYSLDLYLRYLNLNIDFGGMFSITSDLFTATWLFFFIFMLLLLKPKLRKIVHITILTIFTLLFLTDYLFLDLFNIFFSIKSITMVGEGKNYFSLIFSYINIHLISLLLLSFLSCFLGCYLMPKDTIKKDKVLRNIFLICSISFYIAAKMFLGAPADKSAWDAWNYKRNIYNDFTDTKKCLQTLGLYEYTMRDIYLSITSPFIHNNKQKLTYLNKFFATTKEVRVDNNWTNKFKDKNLILVLMESIDSWLVDDNTMPTVSMMMETGINFTNHFAPMYVGGATFNSEFIINTGYMTPFNESLAANTYGKNNFRYALPKLLENKNYTSNFFHMNYGTFYNRSQMSLAYGYEHYYSSMEMGISMDEAYKDTHFMTNDILKKLILPDHKFMSFIVSYSTHVPYTLDSTECSGIISDEAKKAIEEGSDEELICIKTQAKETDNFFKLLIDNLKKEDKLDDTVIIGVTDHYVYGFTDRDKIYELKGIDDYNLMQKEPFFIWSNDIKSYEVTKVNSSIDVLPTIANLFGLDWQPKYYLGKDIFDPNYNGIVFFNDYSWYDGNVYYKDKKIVMGNNETDNYINEKNKQISDILKLNKYILNTNYFNNKNT